MPRTHQSQLPPTDPRQRGRVLSLLKGQPAYGAGQSRATAARRPSPLRPRTLDKDHGRIETRELWCVPTDPKTMGLAGVAQVMRIHSHTQDVRQGKVTKETDDVRFAVTTYGPRRPARTAYWNWPAAIGASKTDNTTAGIAPRTKIAARCAIPPRHAICPCFGPWPSFCSRDKLKPRAQKSLPDFEATFTASLGA